MTFTKTHSITFDTEYTILSACLTGSDEWVMLISSGQVIKYKMDGVAEHIFSVKTSFEYKDGGFDLSAASSIYILDSIIVVVNDYKTHGYVFIPGIGKLHLWREDYHADISRYPIALFKNDNGVPHLIYGVAWNRLHIMDLDTREILTAAKSLINERSEEYYRRLLSENNERPTSPWPTPYDYFYGQIVLSPNGKQFLSKGWEWGSSDAYMVYDIADFISNNKIRDKYAGGGEHSNRAVCWLDDNTIATPYYPWREGDDGYTEDMPAELLFYDISEKETQVVKRFVTDAFDEVAGELVYSKELNALVAFTKTKGLTVFTPDGNTLLRDDTFKPDSFYPELSLFLSIHEKTITVHQLS